MPKRLLLPMTILMLLTSQVDWSGSLLAAGQWTALEDGTRVPVPPAEHPRLFIRAGDLDDLRARIKHE